MNQQNPVYRNSWTFVQLRSIWISPSCNQERLSGFIWNSNLVQISCLSVIHVLYVCMYVCMCGFVFSWHIRHCTYSMWTGEADRPQNFSGQRGKDEKYFWSWKDSEIQNLNSVYKDRLSLPPGTGTLTVGRIEINFQWRTLETLLKCTAKNKTDMWPILLLDSANNRRLILQRDSNEPGRFWRISPFSPSASHEGCFKEMMLTTMEMIDADDERQ